MNSFTRNTIAAVAVLVGITSTSSAGLLLPAVQHVRVAADRTETRNAEYSEAFLANTPEPGTRDFELLNPEEQQAILVGLLLPAVQQVREAARR